MNAPIKPPSGTPFAPPPEPVADVAGTEKPNETFREVLDEIAPVGETSNAREVSFDSVRTIADQLRAGEIDTSTALEKLVENTLEDLSIRTMHMEERLEIEKLLRAALQDDPSLVALAADLRRREPTEK